MCINKQKLQFISIWLLNLLIEIGLCSTPHEGFAFTLVNDLKILKYIANASVILKVTGRTFSIVNVVTDLKFEYGNLSRKSIFKHLNSRRVK
ncbi:unnamed protein product [Schistosoma curassoni]|nr:unnamed protein product [Schistosoma curassoni]